MLSTLHTEIRGPNLMAGGYLPILIPYHQVDLLMGIKGGIGGLDFGFPRICGKRMKPVSGSWCILDHSRLFKHEAILRRLFIE